MNGLLMVLAGRIDSTDGRGLFPAVLAAACFAILACALGIQYMLAVEPCVLCTYQRIAYGIGGALALSAFLARRRDGARTALIALAGLVLLTGSAIAFYHVGVEHHWWGSAFCSTATTGGPGSLSVTDLRAQITGPVERPCDVIDWTLFGLSMATYNVGLFLGLGAAALTAAVSRRARP